MMLDRTEIADNASRADAAAPARPAAALGRAVHVLAQILFMFAILGGAYFAMDRLIASRTVPEPRVPKPPVFTIQIATLVHSENRPAIGIFGQVEAARKVELRSLVSGEVKEVHPALAAGRRVSRGDVLIRVDPFAYEGALLEARANLASVKAAIAEIDARLASESEQLASAEQQLVFARNDLDRAMALSASGTLTSRQLEDRKLVLSQREQAVGQRRNNILIAQAQRVQQTANAERLDWKVREAERRLTDTALIAPFDGIVSEETVDLGRAVSTNDMVVALYDDTALEVRFTLTNGQYGRMATDDDPLLGRPVEITWTVGGADYHYRGAIDRVGARIAAERGGVEVFARLEKADYAVQLRPGALVALTVPDRNWPGTARMPETALYDSDHVFEVVDGKLERRDVRVVAYDGEDVILETGMPDGAEVMVTRLTEATPGLSVRVPGAKPAAGFGN